MRRLSNSNWVSPGPRVPMPPCCRSKWVQPRINFVDKCWSCANSTWSFPSCVRALWEKISSIKDVLSTTLQHNFTSRLRSWVAERLWLKMTTLAEYFRTKEEISASFPLPTNHLGLGTTLEPSITLVVRQPADLTRFSNSDRSSWFLSPVSFIWTSRARSPPECRSKNNDTRFKVDHRQEVRDSLPPPHQFVPIRMMRCSVGAISPPAMAQLLIWHACKPFG